MSDESLHLAQSADSEKESAAADLRPSSPGPYASTKYENSIEAEDRQFLVKEKELTSLSSSEAVLHQPGAFGLENHSQRSVLPSPEFKFLELQDSKRRIFHKAYRPVDNSAHADEYVGCIKIICQIATGDTLNEKQAQNVKDCGDSLIINMRSEG